MEAAATMVFVYVTLKRGFPNHPRLAAFGSPFVGAASTAAPVSLVIGPYSVPFLLPSPTPSSGRLVSGELYSASPSALADLDALEGTHLGVYERRRISVVVDGTSKEVEAEAYFANASYAEALWRRCGGRDRGIHHGACGQVRPAQWPLSRRLGTHAGRPWLPRHHSAGQLN